MSAKCAIYIDFLGQILLLVALLEIWDNTLTRIISINPQVCNGQWS